MLSKRSYKTALATSMLSSLSWQPSVRAKLREERKLWTRVKRSSQRGKSSSKREECS
jgi:hypothetical protein